MFAKIFLVALALFAVAFAAPEPRPQLLVPGATAYSAYSAPLASYSAPLTSYSAYSGIPYTAYSGIPYSGYSGVYPSIYGAVQPAAVVV